MNSPHSRVILVELISEILTKIGPGLNLYDAQARRRVSGAALARRFLALVRGECDWGPSLHIAPDGHASGTGGGRSKSPLVPPIAPALSRQRWLGLRRARPPVAVQEA